MLPSLLNRSSALFETVFLRCFRALALIKYARSAHFLIASTALIGLAGCSTVRIVDSQVAAFSKLEAAPAAASAWRFEQLPSQQKLDEASAAKRNKLESMAAAELAKVGFASQPLLTNSNQSAYTVQLSARIQRLERGPFDSWDHPVWGLPGRDYVVTGSGRVIPAPFFPRLEPPWYVREVSLLIRDARDNRIVYETQARHEGRWADDEAVLPAMLAAALQGFPKPPEGKRMVNIEIPR
jgi:Domain of unknown function (DUF4136)